MKRIEWIEWIECAKSCNGKQHVVNSETAILADDTIGHNFNKEIKITNGMLVCVSNKKKKLTVEWKVAKF